MARKQIIAALCLAVTATFTLPPAGAQQTGRFLVAANQTVAIRAGAHRFHRDLPESRIWGFVLDGVMKRPAIAAVLSGGALVALAIPTLTMHTQLPSFTDLPKSLPIVQTYESIQRAFPGAQSPAKVVVSARDVTSPQVQRAIGELKQRALASGQMFEPISTEVNSKKTIETVSIAMQGNGSNGASVKALETLRERVIPSTLGAVSGVKAAVTGETAGTHDFNEQMKSHAPIVFAFVLLLCFLLLLVTFRSVVIPAKAVLLNLLSVGAAYGLLVLVFQHTWAEGILGFHSNGAITSWLPLFMFVILFGLSMDYHVFILSRVKELVDEGMPTDQAVAIGIKRTASTVTSAAIVMVAVFAIFMSLRTIDIKQMGFGLAAAILIDATIVRAVLLPSMMKMLGDEAWAECARASLNLRGRFGLSVSALKIPFPGNGDFGSKSIVSDIDALCWSMIPRVKPEGMLFGKPVATLGSSPTAGFFRIMLSATPQAVPPTAKGRMRSRLPVAAKTALATAGPTGATPGSPTPVGASGDCTICTSTFGISSMRSTR